MHARLLLSNYVLNRCNLRSCHFALLLFKMTTCQKNHQYSFVIFNKYDRNIAQANKIPSTSGFAISSFLSQTLIFAMPSIEKLFKQFI